MQYGIYRLLAGYTQHVKFQPPGKQRKHTTYLQNIRKCVLWSFVYLLLGNKSYTIGKPFYVPLNGATFVKCIRKLFDALVIDQECKSDIYNTLYIFHFTGPNYGTFSPHTWIRKYSTHKILKHVSMFEEKADRTALYFHCTTTLWQVDVVGFFCLFCLKYIK